MSNDLRKQQALEYHAKGRPGKVEVIPTTSLWFGVTYKEDAPFVQQSLNSLINAGEYPDNLWA